MAGVCPTRLSGRGALRAPDLVGPPLDDPVSSQPWLVEGPKVLAELQGPDALQMSLSMVFTGAK